MAKGRKTGGRKAGTPNRRTVEQAAAVASSGLTPLDFMLKIMRNTKNPAMVRLDAAHKAAPYCHARLATVEMRGTPTPYVIVAPDVCTTAAEWVAKYGPAGVGAGVRARIDQLALSKKNQGHR